jgi:hypothetical protein
MFSHRHPELPPLITEVSAPRLKDYLEKPRLVSTYGRRPSQVLTLPYLASYRNTWRSTYGRRPSQVLTLPYLVSHRAPVISFKGHLIPFL